MREFISYLEARSIVLDHVPAPDIEKVPLDAALGRTLAQAIESGELIPPFDNSAMDGFVVRSSDVRKPGVQLPIVGTIAAGDGAEAPLTSGTCMRIMTGAPIPDGGDAVIPVEQADVYGTRVRFRIAAESPGKLIRRAGENVKIGDRVLEPGLRITPPIIGILATLGYGVVDVARRPVVGIIATGNELVDASQMPGAGQIRDANGPVLAAQVATAGGRVDGPDRVGDNRELLRRTLESKASADLLVVSGGVSMGEFDFVREELEGIGFKPLFWKVRQKPGKPILFGMIDKTPVFGLPGNPVSASVCFEQYVRPAMATMLGRSEISPPLEKAVLDEDVSKRAGLHHFVRGRLRYDDGLRVAPTGPQGSHISHSLVIADCLIHLPEDMADPRFGTEVTVERLYW